MFLWIYMLFYQVFNHLEFDVFEICAYLYLSCSFKDNHPNFQLTNSH